MLTQAALAVCLATSPVILLPGEEAHLPLLRGELAKYWPDVEDRSMFAAQVQTESCTSLKSKKCWTPFAELKTDREYGFGLGQITVTKSFDNFQAARRLDSSLKDWSWENRYNATYQLRTLVLMDKFNYGKFSWAESSSERMAFSFGAYNGGIGGVLSDRGVCKLTLGCNPNKWFGNVENTSKKAKVAVKGYGQSFFQINRNYVSGVTGVTGTRRNRYYKYFGECPDVQ